MPEQPESVYYDSSNVGDAVVFQRETPNLFDLLDKMKKEKKAEKKAEKDEMKEMLKWYPDEPFYPAKQEINKMYESYTNEVANIYKAGKSSDYDAQAWMQKEKNRINRLANKSTQIQGQIIDIQKDAEGLKQYGFDASSVMNEALNGLRNEDGSFKSVEEWELMSLNDYKNDPRYWNATRVGDLFVKGLGTEINAIMESSGAYDVTTKYEVPPFVRTDPQGKPMFDKESGEPIMNVTPELIQRVRDTQGADAVVKGILTHLREDDPNATYKDATEAFLKNYNNVSVKDIKKQANQFALIGARHQSDKKKNHSANNFLLQMSSMFNGVYSLKDGGASITNDKGQELLPIVSPIDNRVIKGTDKDGKAMDVTAQVFTDGEGKFYMKKSNEEVLQELNTFNFGDVLEGFKDTSYRDVFLDPELGWADADGNFVAKGLNETSLLEKKKTEEGVKAQQQAATTARKEVDNWKTNSKSGVVKFIDDIGGSINAVGDEDDVKKLNSALKKLPKDISIEVELDDGGYEKIDNPKISVDYSDETIDINGTVVKWSDDKMKAILNSIKMKAPKPTEKSAKESKKSSADETAKKYGVD